MSTTREQMDRPNTNNLEPFGRGERTAPLDRGQNQSTG
jgi:hypothetical protein